MTWVHLFKRKCTKLLELSSNLMVVSCLSIASSKPLPLGRVSHWMLENNPCINKSTPKFETIVSQQGCSAQFKFFDLEQPVVEFQPDFERLDTNKRQLFE